MFTKQSRFLVAYSARIVSDSTQLPSTLCPDAFRHSQLCLMAQILPTQRPRILPILMELRDESVLKVAPLGNPAPSMERRQHCDNGIFGLGKSRR
jgi:hypothetical protein